VSISALFTPDIMATVRQTLTEQQVPVQLFHQQAPTLTEKAGAVDMPAIQGYTVLQPGNLFGAEGTDDTQRLEAVGQSEARILSVLGNEGDVHRKFSRMTVPVVSGFTRFPSIQERSEVGPPGDTSTAVTVDCRYTFNGRCVLIGELKTHYTIDQVLWNAPNNTNVRDLAQTRHVTLPKRV
jgi:hypothetical protein